jgi:hypothetical protein
VPEDLPIVPSLDDLKAIQTDIEALKARVAVLEGLASVAMPDNVKTALATFLDWVKANV